jgi:hypothetical protein
VRGTTLTPSDGSPLSSITTDCRCGTASDAHHADWCPRDEPPRPLEPYPPVPGDLESLKNILERTNRLNILEYGVGHSTLVFARHIDRTWGLWANTPLPIRLNVVDASMEYIGYWAKQIIEACGALVADELIYFHHKTPELVNIGNQIVSCYPYMPKVPPDFIYIDAPEPYQTKMPDAFAPIIGDVLRYEAFLLPNTIIVIDGRAMQARFLFRHLKNQWHYRYCPERDQHFFVQAEGTLGLPKHEKLIKEVYYANGEWTIEDL